LVVTLTMTLLHDTAACMTPLTMTQLLHDTACVTQLLA